MLSPAPLPLAAADKTVKVWDVATQACQHTLSHHSGKVQSVAWNPAEAAVLLSGGFDKRACVVSPGLLPGGPQRLNCPARRHLWQLSPCCACPLLCLC